MKKICVLICLFFSLSVFAQTDRAGTIVSIKGQEIQVRNENVDAPFMAGERLHLLTGEKSVVLEVTFPMQTVAKCRLVSGSATLLRVGMIVCSGGLSSAGKDAAPEERAAAVKSEGSRMVKGKDVRITLPAAAFVLKDARVPEGGIDFPTGVVDNTTARIERDFLIAETETTFAQWTAVKRWAEAHGYSFSNNGQNGQTSDKKAMNESDSIQYPVTCVNWRDAVVWCNALTEYYNAAQGKAVLDCVYYTDASYSTPLRSSTDDSTITYSEQGSQDCPYIRAASEGNVSMDNCIARGFRLPTSQEWEYAARYRGSDSTNSVDGYKNPFFTKGGSASGASGSCKDNRATDSVAVFGKYDGDSATGVTATARVKSKRANALGLYDMSGNIFEWCFDWYEGKTENRVLRGGSFNNYAAFTSVDDEYDFSPSHAYFTCGFGFRFSRNK